MTFKSRQTRRLGGKEEVPTMNSLRTAILAGLGLGLAALSPAAAATSAFVNVTISEWAGPSTYYPVVYVIPAGATVTMFGCLDGGSWCDVSYAGERGWVPGTYLEAYYESEPVFVPYYVAVIGVPIIGFDIDVYWNNCYRDRPFFANFGERDRFERYAHSPGARIAAAAVVPGPGVKGGRLVAHPDKPQTFAATGKIDNKTGKMQAFAATGKTVNKTGKMLMLAATGKTINKTGKTQIFAAVAPKHSRVLIAGKVPHTMVATGAVAKRMQFIPGPGPSKVAMAPHAGPRPCPKGHACTF